MSKTKKILKTPLRISMTLILFGMLSSMLQWPYASEILLLAFSATAFLYTIRFWKKSEKGFLDYIKLTLVVFWSTNGIFQVLNLPYSLFFQVIIAITFITWFVMEGTAYFLDEDRKTKNSKTKVIWNCAMVFGTLLIIAGSLLKVMNWEFAIPLLGFGIFIVAAYILKDIFPINKTEEGDRNNEEFQL
ncbi:MAG: hypothetical protein HKN31_07125 [Pricia sp.]|nr:hypothetical protein [Pricia sp.]